MFRRLLATLFALGLNVANPSAADAVVDDGDDGDHPAGQGRGSAVAPGRSLAAGRAVRGWVGVPPHGPGRGGGTHFGHFDPSRFERVTAAPAWISASPFEQFVGTISFVGHGLGLGLDEDALIARLAGCRERGDLKVRVITGPDRQVERVRRICEEHGFMFARRRDSAGGPLMEFYTDLYYRSRSGSDPPAQRAREPRFV